ncbi:MAG: mycofactocin biosynthesis glycosyltransferase MftF, partial [Acidimicrobiia bacterium]
VKDRPAALTRLLRALDAGTTPVVVVDDGSTDDSGAVARALGATVLRREHSGGPAVARNQGFEHAEGELVAFLDSDCVPEEGWLEALTAHFADPLVGAVAPRVVVAKGSPSTRTVTGGRVRNAMRGYESARSPLDLGPEPAAVRPGGMVPYVPGAALVVRREAMIDAGGFDESLRFGEDVDLVWRLHGLGWSVRFDPLGRVVHEHGRGLSSWVAARVGYGSSAAPLAQRHPGDLAPVHVSGWTATAWALAAAGAWPAGAALAGASVWVMARRLRSRLPPLRERARLAASGHLAGGRQLAAACQRAWLPILAAASLRSRRARRVLVVTALLPGLLEWSTRSPPVGVAPYCALRVLDDAAYCAGVWAGCVRLRTAAPLLPSWRRQKGIATSPNGGISVRPLRA